MMKHVFAADINLDEVPEYIQKKFFYNASALKGHLKNFASEVEEVFILSTKNRFSIYAVNDSIAPLVDFFSKYSAAKGFVQYYYNTEESVTHLFATSSGLLSQVKGEHQILTQLKLAYHMALECNTLGLILDNMLRQAIAVGKKVRTQTGIGQHGSSIVEAGISLIYDKLDDIYDKKFLIIGTDQAARIALDYLYQEGVSNIVITSHDAISCASLADQYRVNAIGLGKINEHLSKADVIIGATNHELVINNKTLTELCLSNVSLPFGNKMQFILDFGMPGNFEERLKDYGSFELYNLNELKSLDKTSVDVLRGLDEAWQMIMQESKDFLNVLRKLELSPILASYWAKSDNHENKKFEWLLPEAENPTEYDVELMKKFAQQLIKKISSEAVRNTRNIENNFQARDQSANVDEFCTFRHIQLPIIEN